MRRALIIARREYLSFLRTPGFWVSLMVMPLVGFISTTGPQMIARSEPPPVMVILDQTGLGPAGPGADLQRSLSRVDGHAPSASTTKAAGRPKAEIVAAPAELAAATTPKAAGDALLPYLSGRKSLPDGRSLSAAAIVFGDASSLKVDLWTPSPQVAGLSRYMSEPLDTWLRRARFKAAGLDPSLIDHIDQNLTDIRDFSPKAAGGRVSFADRLPMLAAVGLSFALWALVLTGAGILLNTVIEEKSNRVIEVLLSSASVTEILGGKILGGACLSFTMLGFWGAIGVFLLHRVDAGMLASVGAALLGHGLIFWFAAFFLMGYLMYASIFAAVGSYCETPREAQTLLGPIMLLLTVPIIFLGAAISAPDAPLLKILAWVPVFTPFLMTTQVAAGAPFQDLALALVEMAVTTALVVNLSGRAFRSGALATERLSLQKILGKLFDRQA